MKRIALLCSVLILFGCAGTAIAASSYSQEQELTASDGLSGDYFGFSLAMSGDGSRMVIAAGSVTRKGAVYVYLRSGTSWVLEQKITAADAVVGDGFGSTVAINNDGSYFVVTSSYATIGGNVNQGSAYIYSRSGTTWTEQQKLTAPDGGAGDYYGDSSAISADGTRVLIGASYATVGGNANQGAVYVYSRSGSIWTQEAKLTASDGAAGSYFSVYSADAINSDGSLVVVGATSTTVNGNTNQGAAYVYSRSGTTWTEIQKITASDGVAGDYFGAGVALSGDDAYLLLGAQGVDGNRGAAYIFFRSGNTWLQSQKLTASVRQVNNWFGFGAALNKDGTRVLVGDTYAAVGSNLVQGSAYIYSRTGTTWTEDQVLTASDGQVGDYLGYINGAMTADGSRIALGTGYRNTNTGAAYVFFDPSVGATTACHPEFSICQSRYAPSPTPTPSPSPTPTPTPSPSPTPTPPLTTYIKEGTAIDSPNSTDPDVYIVNEWGFKRLFLNPVIFGFYGHLTYATATPVSPAVRDSYPTSGLFRNCETNDQSVYALQVTGEDTGVLHHVALTGDQAVAQDPDFFHKVFCINTNEFNWYPKGTPFTALSQVPVYVR